MGICQYHFVDNDYLEERSDSNRFRKGQLGSLSNKRLRKDAVPSWWPSCPSYLSRTLPQERPSTSHSDIRHAADVQRVEEENEAFLSADKIDSIDDALSILNSSKLPEGVIFQKNGDHLVLYSVEISQDGYVTIPFSLTIFEDLIFSMFVQGIKIPSSSVRYISTNTKFCSGSEILNVIAHLKGMSEPSTEDCIYSAISSLERAASLARNEELQQQLSFFNEQLSLVSKAKTARRYSSSLLSMAALWNQKSPSLYRQIVQESLLILPSVPTIKRLSSALNVESGSISSGTITYLKARFQRLEDREKIVAIAMDEVFCAKRLEYSGGVVYGMEDGNVTKTLLTTMIYSIAGKYHDVVSLSPIVTIDAKKIQDIFSQLLEVLVDIGFSVVAVTVDGHSANMKFYKDLGGGDMKPYIQNPFKDEEKVFLLFDSVHLFKNYYNNFERKKVFVCPAFSEGESPFVANFNHLKKIYEMEMGMPIKFGFKLSDKCLNPAPIEKTNVMLANSVFHESTINALEHYAEKGFPEFKETAKYLRIIRTWFDIMNVKKRFTGQQKRDINKMPFTLEDQNIRSFLSSFSKWLNAWRDNSSSIKNSLSYETFRAGLQTTEVMPKLAEYLCEEKGLEFVLTGKIQSDLLERRFGWFRKLNGSNFF